jgi:hypothetical protein
LILDKPKSQKEKTFIFSKKTQIEGGRNDMVASSGLFLVYGIRTCSTSQSSKVRNDASTPAMGALPGAS